MKNILLFISLLLFVVSMQAQAPQMFNYQAVVRNAAGEVVAEKEITLKIEILSSTDEVVYTETHGLTTNKFGLINTPIGAGESNHSLADINWSKDYYKVRVSFDADGGNNFTELGENQLLSVPYALHAASVATKQQLSINGNTLSLSDGGSVTLPDDMVDDADADATNELQTLSIDGDTIFLSNGGKIVLPKSSAFSGSFADLTDIPANLDTDATDDFDGNYNSLTNLPNWSDSLKNIATFSGNYADLTNKPSISDSVKALLPDLSAYDTNADDDFDGNYNSLANLPNWSDSIAKVAGGSNFSGSYNDLSNLPSWNDSITAKLPDLTNYDSDASDDFSGIYNDLISLPSWSDSISKYIATVDGSSTNEIQDLELVGSTLRITNNASATDINLAPFTGTNTDEQTLSFGGTTLAISNGNFVDLSTLQDGYDANTDAQTLSLSGTDLTITGGNTIDVSTLKEMPTGGTNGQVLKTDGSGNYAWVDQTTDTKLGDADIAAFGYIKDANDGDSDATNELELPAQTGNSGKYLTTNGSTPAWSTITTFSGNFNDLINVPANLDIDDTDDFDGAYSSLSGTPTNVSTFTNDAGYLTAVAKIQGRNVSSSAPANGQILKWNSSSSVWEPADDALGAAGTSDGVVSSAAVTGTSTKTITLTRTESLGNITATFSDMVDDADADATNELQDLSITGNTLSLSDDGTSVDLSPFKGPFSTTSNVTSNANGTLASDDFVFGSTVLSDNGNVNNDSRMYFDKSKRAFRAGYAASTQWDEANVGIGSVGFGDGTKASGDYASALGYRTTASGNSSFASGSFTTASNDYASAFGYGTVASGLYSTTFGAYTTAQSYLSAVFGLYNELSGSSDSYVTTDPLFIVGNGTSASTRSNALTILKNGNMGIGVSDPDATLEVNGSLHYTDGNEGTGKVLTSDANGNATWQTSTNTDNQTLSLNTHTLAIASGNSVDLSGYMDNTDNQTIDVLNLNGTNLEISLESDGQATKTLDLSDLQDGYEANTDEQTLSLSSTDLSISGGNTISLASLQDGTGSDDQKIDVLSISGSTLSISLEGDAEATKTLDISSVNTDDQTLTEILTVNTSAGSKNITNLADPVNDQDAATKAYVDMLKQQITNLENSLIEAGSYKLYDIDGNSYNVVKIGDQVWMAENLKVTHYPDGTAIPTVSTDAEWGALADDNVSDAICYYNDNASGEANTYGALYTYAAAIGNNWTHDNNDYQGVCPDGWHLPSDAEFSELNNALSYPLSGADLKEDGTTHWTSPNTGATNSSGFTGLPGGHRFFTDGSFGNITLRGNFWSRDWWSGTEALYYFLEYDSAEFVRGTTIYRTEKSNGYSVRCIKD